jgi:hypothetical protein
MTKQERFEAALKKCAFCQVDCNEDGCLVVMFRQKHSNSPALEIFGYIHPDHFIEMMEET